MTIVTPIAGYMLSYITYFHKFATTTCWN